VKLSPHFSLDELTRSATAVRLGIDNTPPEGVFANLGILAQGLEEVRELLGHQLHIDSGYRCDILNAAVRGSRNSAHTKGYAADFVCPAYGTPLEIVRAIVASDIQFDQCIQEGTWVHISFDPQMRREVLTAHFSGGKVSYTAGV
jgi:hypothetical protein